MSKRSRKNQADRDSSATIVPPIAPWIWTVGLPLLLAAVAFFAYWPSLRSDFVYDARVEVFEEGFFTNLANLPAVLSLKVLGLPLILSDRPGQLLYLMLNAAVWGTNPRGYHLGSNLLHAANTGLLFVLALRLAATDLAGLAASEVRRAYIVIGASVLIFALHPISTETVAAINYSSDLLMTFFTLLALLAATAFRPGNFRTAWLMGAVGTACAFAAVTCKESGIAAALLLTVYWWIFRRPELKTPWLLFLGAAITVSAAFLAARFALAPGGQPKIPFLGGSFAQVLWVQPRLWVLMIGKLFWPANLSADYTIENAAGISTPVALVVLAVIIAFQIWLSRGNRLAAFGVAIFWLGLATVSNFMPLYRIMGDRFYYLPLAGAALQLIALLFLILKSRTVSWLAIAPLLLALVPLTWLTLNRETVFADEYSLWSDTVRASPFSWTAQNQLGAALSQRGDLDGAIVHYQRALEINPDYAEAHNNLGIALYRQDQTEAAMAEYRRAISSRPTYAEAHYNLGNAFLSEHRFNDAIAEYSTALEIKPHLPEAHCNLGTALLNQGDVDRAIAEYQAALEIAPGFADAQRNLALAWARRQRAESMPGPSHPAP
jgi:tetratricopeptide (TPR) repeat protein